MEAGSFTNVFAVFNVPGLNPRTTEEVHARLCGGVASRFTRSPLPPIECYHATSYLGHDVVVVPCGQESPGSSTTAETAHIWLH